MRSQGGRYAESLRTQGAVKCAFRLLALVRVLLPRPFNRIPNSDGRLLTGRLAERVVLTQSVLTAVRLHVLGEGKLFATFGATEGLLSGVQVLVLMQEAAVLESLAADGAHVGAAAVGVLAPVVFHDGVVLENHAALGAFVGFEGRVGFLVEAQSHDVREDLVALLAFEDVIVGARHHVLTHVLCDGRLELEILAAQRAVVRLLHGVAAVVVPQFIGGEENPLALSALEPPVLLL